MVFRVRAARTLPPPPRVPLRGILWLLLSPPARGWSCCSSARVGAAGARARHSESTAGCAGKLKPSLRLCCRGVLLLAHFLFSFLRLTGSSPCRPQVVKTRLMPVIRRDHALVSIRGACSCCFQITFWCVSSCVWLLRLAFLQLSIDASVASDVRQNFRSDTSKAAQKGREKDDS